MSSKKIVKNTSVLLLAFIGRKLLTFVYFALIARYMGANTTGLYFLLIAFSTLFTALMDFGLTPILIREGSQSPNEVSRYFNNIISIKLVLCLVASVSGAVLITLLNYPTITRQLVYLVLMSMCLESFSTSFYGALRVRNEMKYEARGMVIGGFITLFIGGISVWRGLSIYYLVLAIMGGNVFNFLYSLSRVFRKMRLSLRISFDQELVQKFSVLAVPFFLVAIFDKLLFIDTFLLSYLANSEVVGWFSVPSTVVQSFTFIPVALSTALFPALSSYHVTSRERLIRTFERSWYVLTLFIVPSALGIAVLAPEIVRFFFGVSYGASILPLRILIFSLIPIFSNFPIGTLLNACHRQVTRTILMSLAAVLHIVLSILLIPRYAAVGIAWSALTSHALMLFLGIYWVRPLVGKALITYFKDSAKVILAAFLMGIVVIFLKKYLNLFVVMPVGGFVYVISLLVLQGITGGGFSREKSLSFYFELTKYFTKQKLKIPQA